MADSPIAATPRHKMAVLHEYIRREIAPIYRKSVLLGKMKSAGRISGGHGGDYTEFRPRKRRRTIEGDSGNVLSVAFNQTNVRDVCTLPWRAYKMGEAKTQYEDLASKPAAVKFFKKQLDLVAECTGDFMEDFRTKLWADGGANSTDIHGFQSWNNSTGSCISSSVLADPSDTYAGKSTALGVSGTWSGNFPQGTGSTEYNWWSPFLVDVNNALLSSKATWAANWQYAIRYGLTYMEKLQAVKPDVCILDTEWLREAKDSLKSIQQLDVTSRPVDADPEVTVIRFDGIELASEYGVPANTGWLIPLDKVELRHFGDQLIHVWEERDINTATYKMLFRFFGNMVFDSPAFFCELLEITAGS